MMSIDKKKMEYIIKFNFVDTINTSRLLRSKNLVNNILLEICNKFNIVKSEVDYIYTVDLRFEEVVFLIWLKDSEVNTQTVEELFGTSTNDKEWINKHSNKYIKSKIRSVSVRGGYVNPPTNPSVYLLKFKHKILTDLAGEGPEGKILLDFPVFFGSNLSLDLLYWKSDLDVDVCHIHDLDS